MLTPDEKEKIIKELNSRKTDPSCPMCGNKNFAVADAYFNNILQDDFSSLQLGGPSIPTIPVICTNCGFIAQHALGVLGLIKKDEGSHGSK